MNSRRPARSWRIPTISASGANEAIEVDRPLERHLLTLERHLPTLERLPACDYDDVRSSTTILDQ